MARPLLDPMGRPVLLDGLPALEGCEPVCCGEGGPGDCSQLCHRGCPSGFAVQLGPVDYTAPFTDDVDYVGTVTWHVTFTLTEEFGFCPCPKPVSGSASGTLQLVPPGTVVQTFDNVVETLGICVDVEPVSASTASRFWLQCRNRSDFGGTDEEWAELAESFLGPGPTPESFVTIGALGPGFGFDGGQEWTYVRFAAALVAGKCLQQLDWVWAPSANPTFLTSYTTNSPGVSWS